MTEWLERHMPKFVMAPSFVAILIFVYGFIGWTAWVSFTKSRLLPKYDIVGTIQYDRLFQSPRWETAINNLYVFGILFIVISMCLGLILAIFLDQKIRVEGVIRTIYLYPMALSMIVTGTAWKWILNPGLGIEATVRKWGYENFTFDWLVNPDMAIYTVVLAGVWQSSGFVMALFGWPPLRRRRDYKSCASGWYSNMAHLFGDHNPLDGPNLLISFHRSIAFGD